MVQRPPPLADAEAAEAVLTVDLDAIGDNWRRLALLSAPAQCAAVVKANAYGIGVVPVVSVLAEAGCRTFFVAQASEGVNVRETLVTLSRSAAIYVFSGFDGCTAGDYQRHGLRPVLSVFAEAEAWLSRPGDVAAALHVDTGMNRLGVSEDEAKRLAEASAAPGVNKRFDFLLSHFIAAEQAAHPLNRRQIALFERTRAGFVGIPASLANSSGIFLPGRPHYDLVRPGYALYGGNPTPGSPNPMRPVVQLTARIIQIRTVDGGASVGYHAEWTAARPSRLATIGIGYADGLPRSAGAANGAVGAKALVNGTACAIVGRVSMDLAVVDVTDVPAAGRLEPGQFVELLGDSLGIDDLAVSANRSGYEILTALGARYKRHYKGGR